MPRAALVPRYGPHLRRVGRWDPTKDADPAAPPCNTLNHDKSHTGRSVRDAVRYKQLISPHGQDWCHCARTGTHPEARYDQLSAVPEISFIDHPLSASESVGAQPDRPRSSVVAPQSVARRGRNGNDLAVSAALPKDCKAPVALHTAS